MVNGQCRYDFLVLCYLESVSIRQLSVYLPPRNTTPAGRDWIPRSPDLQRRSHSEEEEQFCNFAVAPR